jgi:hypothetical protein
MTGNQRLHHQQPAKNSWHTGDGDAFERDMRTDLLSSTASSNSEKTPLSLDALILPVLSGDPPDKT